jgi:hypothetical protein
MKISGLTSVYSNFFRKKTRQRVVARQKVAAHPQALDKQFSPFEDDMEINGFMLLL